MNANQPIANIYTTTALRLAREVVSPERARDLQRLLKWKALGCLMLQPRPDVPDPTPEEDEAIKGLWRFLPGWTSYSTAVNILTQEVEL